MLGLLTRVLIEEVCCCCFGCQQIVCMTLHSSAKYIMYNLWVIAFVENLSIPTPPVCLGFRNVATKVPFNNAMTPRITLPWQLLRNSWLKLTKKLQKRNGRNGAKRSRAATAAGPTSTCGGGCGGARPAAQAAQAAAAARRARGSQEPEPEPEPRKRPLEWVRTKGNKHCGRGSRTRTTPRTSEPRCKKSSN